MFVGTPSIQTRALLISGNPEQLVGSHVVFNSSPLSNSLPFLPSSHTPSIPPSLPQVTVTRGGLLNVHGWLPFSSSRNRPFTFQFDPNAQFDKYVVSTREVCCSSMSVKTHLSSQVKMAACCWAVRPGPTCVPNAVCPLPQQQASGYGWTLGQHIQDPLHRERQTCLPGPPPQW